MAIKKGSSSSHATSGGQKRLERKEVPTTSLGPREPTNGEKSSSLSISALAALRQQKGNVTLTKQSSNTRKRGHSRKAENRAKQERAIGNADRLQMKASKRSARDERRKRAKEILQ